MKFKNIVCALSAIASLTAFSAENLVMNGTFQSSSGKYPPYWMSINAAEGTLEYFTSGGPDNKPFMRLSSRKDMMQIKQTNLTLVRGESYRVSAYFRTKNLKNKESGIWVGIGPWAKFGENCFSGLSTNIPEWRKFETIIKMDKAEPRQFYNFYTFDIVLAEGGGQMDIADVRLEAVKPEVQKLSKSCMDSVEPHLVPVCPLSEIPAHQPELDFCWVGPFTGDPAGFEVEVSFDTNGKKQKFPFQLGRFTVNVKDSLPAGRSVMTAKVLNRKSGEVLYQENFKVRSVTVPEVKNARQLNNMVKEIYNGDLKADQEFTLPNPRYGFIFFRFIPDKKGVKFNLKLDEKELLDQSFARGEVIRLLDVGKYTLKSDVSGKLILRLIPDILNFGGPSHAYAPGNGYYNWGFHKRYVVPGMTTFTGGRFPPHHYAEMKKLGCVLLHDQGIASGKTKEKMESILEKSRVARQNNDGFTLDEAECFYPPLLEPLAYALRRYKNPFNKTIVTYMTGPVTPSNLNFLSVCANASEERGYLAIEYYLRGQKDLTAAKNIIHQLGQHQWIFKEVAPKLYGKAGVLLGNFSLYPRITLSHYPYEDYKVFLDMQLCAIANDPAFEGIGKVGFWGTYACDEEMVRWSFALMRHYAIEGNKTMLSGKYGFKFYPGLLKNSDFTAGLKDWEASGDITIDSYPQYGAKYLRLWGSRGGVGDTFAIFTRKEGKVNTLTQTAKGLEKGKTYTLYYHTADLDDLICRRPVPKRIPIEVALKGAKILQKVHFNGLRSKAETGVVVNFEKIVFKAESDQVTLTFSDPKAAAGQRNILNYIAVRPYFEREDFK